MLWSRKLHYSNDGVASGTPAFLFYHPSGCSPSIEPKNYPEVAERVPLTLISLIISLDETLGALRMEAPGRKEKQNGVLLKCFRRKLVFRKTWEWVFALTMSFAKRKGFEKEFCWEEKGERKMFLKTLVSVSTNML